MSVAHPHPNRESWLNDVAGRLRPAFAQLGAPLPERLRIAIGFPSAGRRAKATGECWDSTASADATFEILVRPDLAEAEGALALPVAAALARELVHAAVGIQAGRGPAYRKVAHSIGLVGPMRATGPGPAFMALIAPVLDAAGPLPHARLDADRGAAAADQDGGRHRSPPVPASRPIGMSGAPAPPAATSPARRASGSTRSGRPTAPSTGRCWTLGSNGAGSPIEPKAAENLCLQAERVRAWSPHCRRNAASRTGDTPNALLYSRLN